MNTILESLLGMHWTGWLSGASILAGAGIVLRPYFSARSMPFSARSMLFSARSMSTALSAATPSAPGTSTLSATATEAEGTDSWRLGGVLRRTVEKTANSLTGQVVEPLVNRDIGQGRLVDVVNSGIDRVVEIDRYQQSAQMQLDAAEYSMKDMLREISKVMSLPDEPILRESQFAPSLETDQSIAAIAA